MLADFDPAVTAIAAQPFRLTGSDGQRVRRHVPDLLLACADGGTTVVDIKAPGRRADPEVPQGGERRTVDLAAELGGSQASISSHLASLKECGLMTGRPHGRAVYYRPARPELSCLLHTAGQLQACGRAAGLRRLLASTPVGGRQDRRHLARSVCSRHAQVKLICPSSSCQARPHP